MAHELRVQTAFYWMFSSGLVVVGVAILFVASRISDHLTSILLQTGSALTGTVTVFPLATIFARRRKLVILTTFEHELSKPNPSSDAIESVRVFMNRQLTD